MRKDAQKSPRRGGISGSGASHKAITLRYYHAHRTHLLLVKKEDIKWLGLEPGEEVTIDFHRKEGS